MLLELLYFDYRSQIQDALTIILVIAAIVWGGGPERTVAFTWVFAFEFLGLVDDVLTGPMGLLTEVDYFLALKDVVAGVMWIAIALYANRNYTLWIAGFQIIAMSAHLVRGLIEGVSPIAYAVMVVAPGWFQLFLLGIGLTRHILRKRKYGPYRDWRVFRDWGQPSRWREFRNRILTLLGRDFFAKKDKA